MNKTIILLIVAIVAISGCTSQNPDSANNQNGDSVTTFTEGNESFRMTVRANNNTQTYDFAIESEENVTGNEYFSRYDSVNLTSEFSCAFAQQIAYNYSSFSNIGESSGLEESEDLSEGLDSSSEQESSEIPSWVFQEFEPEKVSYTLTSKSTSEELASCQPTEDELNIDINIEPGSENSEGLQ